jgi:hypothetical protein
MLFFFLLQNQRTRGQKRSCLGKLVPVGGGGYTEGCRRVHMGKYSVHMYENGKMTPVETIPGIGGGEIRENDGGSDFSYNTL